MNVSQALSHGGSGVAVVGGMYAMISAFIDPVVHIDDHTSLAGLIVAIAGLATAIGAQVQPALKLLISERREQRRDNDSRRDLQNQLQVAQAEINNLRSNHNEVIKTLEYNRKLILLIIDNHEVPETDRPAFAEEVKKARDTLADSGISPTPQLNMIPNPKEKKL